MILSNKKFSSCSQQFHSHRVNHTEEILVCQRIHMKSAHLLYNFLPNPLPKKNQGENRIFYLYNLPAEVYHCQKHRLITVGAL